MKVFAQYPLSPSSTATTVLGDVAVVPDHHPFFIPDFAETFTAYPALCVRLARVGKSVAVRFADRFVGGVATGILYVADDLLTRLREEGLPWTEAVAFDGAAPIGVWTPCTAAELSGMRFNFFLEDTDGPADLPTSTSVNEIAALSGEDILPRFCETISRLSATITLKTGDIVCMALTPEGVPLQREMRFTAFLNEAPTFSTRIR